MNENTISATGGAAEELEPELDELDIEAFAGLECKPRAKRYIIRIDKKPYVIEKSIVTARELLQIAGKNPPENPADPDVDVWEAVLWAAVSGTLVALARMFAQRKAAGYYLKSKGELPPQLQKGDAVPNTTT